MKSTPVCIVGAGPAGTTASLFLSKLGIVHTILEKAEFPRDKVCGDAIDAVCMRVMNTFDKSLVEEIAATPNLFHPSMGLKFFAPNGTASSCYHRPLTADLPEPLYYVSKRMDFDQFLFKKINPQFAEVHTGTTVMNIERHQNGVVVTYEKNGHVEQVFTNMLLGADGDHSIVLRKLGQRKIDRVFYAAALRMYCTNVADIDPKQLIEIHFLNNIPSGYLWIFPLANNLYNVGIGLASNQASRLNINLKQAFEETLQTHPTLAPRFTAAQKLETPKGWGLPLAGGNRKMVGDNYLLLGDAASLVNPLNGEGIGSAMISGWAAAQYAAMALEKKQFSEAFLQPYKREVTYRLGFEVGFYNNIVKRLSPSMQYAALNVGIQTGFFRYFFEKGSRKWMYNAFKKPLQLKQ